MSVLDHQTHLRKALYPVFVLATVFGVQMFEYRVVVLNYIHFIVTWSIYMLVFTWLWISSNFRILFTNDTNQFVVSTNVITSLMATALTLQHKKKFHRALDDLSIINTTFGVLAVLNGSSKLEKLVRKVIVVWCVTVVYVMLADAIWMILLFGKAVGTLVFLVIDYPYFVNTIVYIIICLILSYTESRFEVLNEHIEKLASQNGPRTCWSVNRAYPVTGQLNPMCISRRKQDIWSLMHVHAELCKICRDLNTLFGVQVTFEIATYFVSVTQLAIYLCRVASLISYAKSYITIEDLSIYVFFRVLMACSWACLYIGRLIYFNHICETITAKAHRTGKLMHHFLNSAEDFEVQAEVQQFILYMLNRPLKFHGAGFFYFGYDFVYMFLSGIITVMVITLQSKSYDQLNLRTFVLPANVSTDAEIISTKVIKPLNNAILRM